MEKLEEESVDTGPRSPRLVMPDISATSSVLEAGEAALAEHVEAMQSAAQAHTAPPRPRYAYADSKRATISSGIAFAAVAYNLFVLDTVQLTMSSIYPLNPTDAASLSSYALSGAVCGMIIFGMAADMFGRVNTSVLAAGVVAAGALACALLTWGEGIFRQLSVWRAVLGFGLGAEYPLIAAMVAEVNAHDGRGRALAMVFAAQGVGRIAAGMVNFIVLSTPLPLDVTWRVALLIGALPHALLLLYRMRMDETPIYMLACQEGMHEDAGREEGDDAPIVARDALHATHAGSDAPVDSSSVQGAPRVEQGGSEDGVALPLPGITVTPTHKMLRVARVYRCTRASVSLSYICVCMHEIARTLWGLKRVCFTLALCWFMLDVFFYGLGLYSGKVLSMIGFTDVPADGRMHAQVDIAYMALGSAIVAILALPGYAVAISSIEWAGRKRMQAWGFGLCAAAFFIIGVGDRKLQESYKGFPFLLLYSLTFVAANWGPNTTTFVLPVESFPTHARCTAHGLAAAAGKLGAVLGSNMVPALLHAYGDDDAALRRGVATAMFVCAGVAGLGAAVTQACARETASMGLDRVEADHYIAEQAEERARALERARRPSEDAREAAAAAARVSAMLAGEACIGARDV